MSLLPITPKASAADDANRTTLGALSGLAANWHTTPSALESGSEHPLDLTCSVSQRSSASQLIGPQGGVLRLGAHSLTVPKGALATTVLISATATVGPSVRIDFAPHGLQFAKAATLVLNYTGCTMPSTGAGNVYYTNEFDAIRQSMPSANDPATKTITALTDHFSGYLVGWGRY